MKKYSRIFETNQVGHDLRGKSVRGGFYVLAATVTTQVLQLGSIVILARILLPEHFGLVSMVTALTVFAERFKHLGLSTATIQQKDITHEQVSTLFWINASIGLLLAISMVGLSRGIAAFYQEPNLIPITMALSLSFVFGGLNVQHEALLRRQMRFRALSCTQVIANGLSIISAIAFALNGYTYWALVWKEVLRSAIELIGVWIACRWRPGLPIPGSGIGSFLRVGRDIVSIDTIFFACRSVDQLLLGKFAGAYALGLYRQAFQLMATPMSQLSYPVGSVALPGLSALQDQPDRYQHYYRKILGLLAFVSMPLITYMAIFSEDIIRIVLGEKWLEAAGVFRVLAIGALIEPLFTTCGIVMITQGKTKRFFWWAVVYGLSLVVAFSIGVRWGATGVAAGYTIAHWILMIPSLWFSFRGTPLSSKLFFQAISVPALFSFIMGIVLMFLEHSTRSLHSTSRIGLSLLTAAILYVGLWLIHPSGREHLLSNISSLLSAFRPAPSN